MEDKIKEIIETINPYLISDGGNVEFVKYQDNIVYIRLIGACAGCLYKDSTINDLILRTIQDEIPEVKDVINIEI